MPDNLLGRTGGTLLPDDSEVRAAIDAGAEPEKVAARFPAASVAWAVLAEHALAGGRTVAAYAFARTGYHRGLDALRRSGWRGTGPVPWRHEANRGFLRCLWVLGVAAAAIGEEDEAARCRTFLRDCDPAAAAALGGSE